jgi:Zinc dependent phospholipase C
MVTALALVALFAPEAHAWGPITHLVHGTEILANLTNLAPRLQEMLQGHSQAYLYGCIAADIIQAKKYTRSVYTHCHCWPVGWQVAEAARSEREQAFAYGYLSHLAGDVFSHNHFVPAQLIVSYDARTLGHAYWEVRFDAAQRRDRWRLVRSVLEARFQDCDELVGRVVERTLFSFRTNKRIFNSLMGVQQLGQWQTMVRSLGERSRFRLPAGDVARFNTVCIDAIQDLLQHGKESACQQSDPVGQDALDRAIKLRRKLRALGDRGQVTPAIASELAALRRA